MFIVKVASVLIHEQNIYSSGSVKVVPVKKKAKGLEGGVGW